MSNGRKRRAKQPRGPALAPAIDRSSPWDIVYYEASDGRSPGLEFLDSCPGKIEAEFVAVLDAVAAAPPPQFSGGGKWEAMHGEMTGYYEIRLTGPGREQFRLFCVLENGTDEELRKRGLVKPAIAVIDGMRKPWRTTLRASHYRDVKKLGEDQLLVVAPPRRLRPRAPGVDETLNQQLAAPTPSLA